MPYGARLTLSAGMTLLLPVSRGVPLPACQNQVMVVSFIPSSYTADSDMITTPMTPRRLSTPGTQREVYSSVGDVFPATQMDGDDGQLD
jgi:hypothetical protein